MVAARSAAMAFNRVLDAEIDAAIRAPIAPPPRGPAVEALHLGLSS
jgi:4-hydroxybenzoate polyprenyltransferase